MLPPMTASHTSVDSRIRHFELFAFNLSIPYKKNATMFMDMRYMSIDLLITLQFITFCIANITVFFGMLLASEVIGTFAH